MTKANHLSDIEIRDLLNGEDQDRLNRHGWEHLDSCSQCQSRLQNEAASPWWWGDGQKLAALTAEISQLPQQDAELEPVFDIAKAEAEAIIQQFEPALHPELLGQIEEYQIEELIGVGGMGVVFKALDQDLNRRVAIKFLSPRLAGSGVARQRFTREAKSVASICHDNVIPIFRINTSAKCPYFVMPYVPGESLDQMVEREGPLDTQQLIQIATQIASGLAAAHSQGLVHRDIKPANILLENNCNRIVITDFGLVKDENEIHLTRTGMIAGTPQFMSPEQADGRVLDSRTDLYSLGAVMYFMATGCAPYKANCQFEQLRMIREEEPRRIRSLNPAVPAYLESLIERLLHKDTTRRLGSATQLSQLLKDYLAYLKDPINHPKPRIQKEASRTFAKWLSVAFLFIAILFGAMMSINQMLKDQESDPQTQNDSNVQKQEADEQEAEKQDDAPVIAAPAKSLQNAIQGHVDKYMESGEFDVHDIGKLLGWKNRLDDNDSDFERSDLVPIVFLGQLNPELASKMVKVFQDESGDRHGRLDLFVAEPILLQVILDLDRLQWKRSSTGLRKLLRILRNNHSAESLQDQVSELESEIREHEEQPDKEAKDELLEKAVQLLKPLSEQFRQRLDRIR